MSEYMSVKMDRDKKYTDTRKAVFLEVEVKYSDLNSFRDVNSR